MKLLLDTHLLLWAAQDRNALPSAAVEWMSKPDYQLFFSVANIWEVSIKYGLGRQDFRVAPTVLRRGLLDAGYLELAILSEHAFQVGSLPPIHKDPFDRILIAQATVEGMFLLTSDSIVARYPGPIQKV